MTDNRDLFSELEEKFRAGLFEHATVHPQRDEMGTEAGKCHQNVREIIRRCGGNIVHGWLLAYEDGCFAAHSLWELDGVLYEITPLGQEGSPPFVRHSALPHVEWSEKPEASSVCRQTSNVSLISGDYDLPEPQSL